MAQYHTWHTFYLIKEEAAGAVAFTSKPEQGCVDVYTPFTPEEVEQPRLNRRLDPGSARQLWRELLAEGYSRVLPTRYVLPTQ